MRRGVARALAAAIVLMAAAPVAAQSTRPRATVKPAVAEVVVAPGATVTLGLEVSMPPDVHVQAHQPKDPLLIPTVLTVEAPEGVTVDAVSYPQPVPFTQQGRPDPLLVLGPTFEIAVRLTVAADTPAGMRSVPVVLRYQACNDTLCFPPARATAAWILEVMGRR